MTPELPIRLPSLFVSHGTPMLALQDRDEDAWVAHLQDWARALPVRPRAVVVVSAHGLSAEDTVEIAGAARHSLIYDFRGFPAALYQVEYPAPGAPELLPRLLSLLSAQNFRTEVTGRGLDHGVWVPLRAAFPEADIPVIQVSLPFPTQPQKALLLGKALAPLREEGVLIVGSGSSVHNLQQMRWSGKTGQPLPWAARFSRWVLDCLREKKVAALVGFEDESPDAALAHPTTEHFYPLFVTLGASLPGDELELIHEGVEYGTIGMECLALRAPASHPAQGRVFH